MAHWTTKTNPLATPCYLIDEEKLNQNLKRIETLKNATDCQVILALKGFATYKTFDQLNDVLDGVTASSIYEARLGLEEFKASVHVHSIAMDEEEYHQYNALASHISFNSIKQVQRFKEKNNTINASLGLRINPKISQAPTEKYDPCSKFSRLGIPIDHIKEKDLEGIDGLHFHALCEQNAGPLIAILNRIEQTLGHQLSTLKWMNWGGGHLLTDDNYELEMLIKEINRWKTTYNIQIILEPGEAIGRHCGYYVTRILDIIENNKKIAICDLSATAHMPDVLEYPYRPDILNAGKENEKKKTTLLLAIPALLVTLLAHTHLIIH